MRFEVQKVLPMIGKKEEYLCVPLCKSPLPLVLNSCLNLIAVLF